MLGEPGRSAEVTHMQGWGHSPRVASLSPHSGQDPGGPGPLPAPASGRGALRGPPAHPFPSRLYSSSSCPGHKESRAPPAEAVRTQSWPVGAGRAWGDRPLLPRFQTEAAISSDMDATTAGILHAEPVVGGGQPGQPAPRPPDIFLDTTAPAHLQPRRSRPWLQKQAGPQCCGDSGDSGPLAQSRDLRVSTKGCWLSCCRSVALTSPLRGH